MDILELLNFIAKFRKDTISELISEAALDILEEAPFKICLEPNQKATHFKPETGGDFETTGSYNPEPTKQTQQSQDKTTANLNKIGQGQSNRQTRVAVESGEQQLREMNKYKIKGPQDRKLCYSSSDDDTPAPKRTIAQKDPNSIKDNIPAGGHVQSGSGEEEIEIDEEEDETAQAEDLINRFQKYEEQLAEFDIGEDYFDDVQAPAKNPKTKKKYVFSHDDPSYHYDNPSYHYDGFGGDRYPVQQSNQRNKPKQTQKEQKPNAGLAQVPNYKMTKDEKKRIERALKDITGKSPSEVAKESQVVNKIAFQEMTKTQERKVLRERASKPKSSYKEGPQKAVSKKDQRKVNKMQKREELKELIEEIDADMKNTPFAEKKQEDESSKSLTNRVKKSKKDGKITDEQAQKNILLYGTEDASLVEYTGMEDTITKELNQSLLDKSTPKIKPSDMPADLDQYLALEDLGKPSYSYEYITDLSDQFRVAMDYIDIQKVVGFDTEFVTKSDMLVATYLQLSSLERGFVINLQNSQFETEFKQRIAKFLANSDIRKVGWSIINDLKALNVTFNHELDFNNIHGIEEMLFTTRSNNAGIGLSEQCRRYYGKPMNKEAQKTIAYHKELMDQTDKDYAAMDALIPICLYSDMNQWLSNKPSDGWNFSKKYGPADADFILDPSCKTLKNLLERSEFGVRVIEKKTYTEISELCKKTDSILVTCDKYQILSGRFPNVMVYYDTKTFKEGNCI